MAFNFAKMLGINHLVQQLRPSVTQIISIALTTGAVTDIIGKVAGGQPVSHTELALAGTTVLTSFCRATIPNLSGLTPADTHSAESQAQALVQGAVAQGNLAAFVPQLETALLDKGISQAVGVKNAPLAEQIAGSVIQQATGQALPASETDWHKSALVAGAISNSSAASKPASSNTQSASNGYVEPDPATEA